MILRILLMEPHRSRISQQSTTCRHCDGQTPPIGCRTLSSSFDPSSPSLSLSRKGVVGALATTGAHSESCLRGLEGNFWIRDSCFQGISLGPSLSGGSTCRYCSCKMAGCPRTVRRWLLRATTSQRCDCMEVLGRALEPCREGFPW